MPKTFCKDCGGIEIDEQEVCHCAESSIPSSDMLATYLTARRKTIEASIAAEVLAGNQWKEACERAALAEITALECEAGTGFRTVANAGAHRPEGARKGE